MYIVISCSINKQPVSLKEIPAVIFLNTNHHPLL